MTEEEKYADPNDPKVQQYIADCEEKGIKVDPKFRRTEDPTPHRLTPKDVTMMQKEVFRLEHMNRQLTFAEDLRYAQYKSKLNNYVLVEEPNQKKSSNYFIYLIALACLVVIGFIIYCVL